MADSSNCTNFARIAADHVGEAPVVTAHPLCNDCMEREMKHLWHEVAAKVNAKGRVSADFEKLSQHFSAYHIHLKSGSLRRLWNYVKGSERPSKEVLDRLALFAGFNDWDTLLTTFKDGPEAQELENHDDAIGNR